MKATIDIPDDIYRKVKAKSALEGRAVREVAIGLFQDWVEKPEVAKAPDNFRRTKAEESTPAWFGCLNKYAKNAKGRHDMESIRKSIARGIAQDRKL
ncbi:MAG TPA: hypothetical protein DCZ95_02290 [Verrucomicrobia bacterium]|nr:MAG: hypothetical protein A2X46_00555 [Lentisphaerae bacterium GWF2_57_35]HBA82901.1 hypothetical protein [Verrucomicrobiota bacterium]